MGKPNLSIQDPGLLAAALDYARHGWPVFPCHPGTKRPLTPKGEDGSGGLKHATTDEFVITAWWRRFPKALIGVPTGKPINAFVLDFDAGTDEKTGEIFTVEDLERTIIAEIGVALPATWIAETPRGGQHRYFSTAGGDQPGNRNAMVRRVDVRGTGGYVIVPPSVRSDGKSYRWIVAPW